MVGVAVVLVPASRTFRSVVGLLHVREGFHVARVVLRHRNMRGKLRLRFRFVMMVVDVISWRGTRLVVRSWRRTWMRVDWLGSPSIGRHLVGGRFVQTVC